MITLADVLLKSGWTQEQIDALDAKAKTGLTDYVTGIETSAAAKETAAKEAAVKAEADRKAAEDAQTAAKAAQDAAELAKRSSDEFWNGVYAPGLSAWDAERQKLMKTAADAEAKAAYYEKQREIIKDLGVDLSSAPDFTPLAAPAPDPKKTPGTPTFVDPNVVVSRVSDGIKDIMNIQWKYQTLYSGQPLPVSPSELIKQADALKLSPMEYASRTFKFAEKEQAAREAAAKAHDDAIKAAAVLEQGEAHKAEIARLQAEFNAKEKLRAEQSGSNPDVKLPPGSSKFADLRRAQQSGERKDPTRMTPQERRQTTIENIHKALEERQTVAA